GREEGFAAEVVPLEEARVEDDARRVHVAPSHLDRRRVLDHVGKRFCFQGNARTITSQEYAELERIELGPFGPFGGEKVEREVDSSLGIEVLAHGFVLGTLDEVLQLVLLPGDSCISSREIP